jgi:dTDP-4-amino-4,6-dideoxygalactose transaminase
MQRVTSSGVYLLGPEVEAFESEFADFIGTRYAVAVSSGTDAITLALRALDIGHGDEVVTVSHTAGATTASILHAGATPVLVDVDPMTLTMAPGCVEAAITDRTRAVVPVHLYGGAADMGFIRELCKRRGVAVVEDCAQAAGTQVNGAHVGADADAAAFSFYPTKNLAALGDAGAVVTSRPEVLEKLLSLRQYGWRTPQLSEALGWNSRMDELQAAVLRVKLRKLPRFTEIRRERAAVYRQNIDMRDIVLPCAGDAVEHSFHLYVIQSAHRDQLADHLRGYGIASAIHYPVPVHDQPGYAARCVTHSLPVTEAAASQVLTLPMFSAISEAQVERVIEGLNSFAGVRV